MGRLMGGVAAGMHRPTAEADIGLGGAMVVTEVATAHLTDKARPRTSAPV